MTITIDIKPEIEAELAKKAAADGRPIEEYIESLVEKAIHPSTGPKSTRPEGSKSLVELFAESPLYGLDLDFSRNKSTGRPIDV